ncbi:calmodulin-binding receptor-like cytoplasmic kinase 2 [Zingiber officinale]|uniref:calmodulin-binding receptor-like cytoplasmic kinase 2 n=1 Tax=Zingiber officinale TaxID=94328 RepID=UPI001C4BC2A2|nr:calmodulin-binding receptor-like cytoplasmic kinase 2 [Zingiber officinale]XP_042407306.1 calmodulin-binding receptor-like cytoplasmic kinase 2 [Zingiber officinale]
MQISGHYSSSFGSEIEDSGVRHGAPREPDLSMKSSYDSSTEIGRPKLQSRNSISLKAQAVASGFVGCFVPRSCITGNDADREVGMPDTSDYSSTSSSKLSTSSSNYRYRTQSSYGKSETRQERIIFSIEEINKATSNFAIENRIGQGAFGAIYKGKLKDGSLIAVKQDKKNMNHMHVSVEFKSEIEILSQVEHSNLVRLLGYLETDRERLMVVEYVSNGNLREHLDGTRGSGLEIGDRLNIAIDVAHAIAYMHTYADHPIIHRDVKASNILLTEKLRAKVADFGFARLAEEDPEKTHISTQIKGTAGYLDPEYLRTYQLTEKSDVYSFGVLLVEMISGRRPIERNRASRERMTTRWAIRRFKEGGVATAMDPRVRRNPASVGAAERVLGLAERCLAEERKSRPAMKECAEVLWGIRRDYQLMLKPRTVTASAPSSSLTAIEEREEVSGSGEYKSAKKMA